MTLPADIADRLRLPVMVAPMFLCSGVELVVASCKAGLVGTLTRNHCRDDAEFEHQLQSVASVLAQVRQAEPARTIGPVAANISLRMGQDGARTTLAACRRHGVDIIVTAAGDPANMAAQIHDQGGRIFHDVTSVRFAEKAIAGGVDGLIAIGSGGGGHSGTISHLTLIPQLRAIFAGVIVMAGGIACGAAVRAAQVLGADLAYMGTRFIATREAAAPDDYKAMLVSQSAADLIYTGAINGVPASWLRESLRRLGLDPDNLPARSGPGTSHLPPHVKPWSNLWSAGQGIGLIDDVPPVAELVERLAVEYLAACAVPARVRATGAFA